MIVPMKKVTILVQSKDIDDTLHALGRRGVLHIEHQNLPAGESIATLKDKYHSLSNTIGELSDIKDQEKLSGDPEALVSEILNLVDKKETLVEDLKKIKKDIETWNDWGDFNPELIDKLSDKNIWVRLCKITKKERKIIPEGLILQEIFKKGNILYAAVISRKETKLPFQTLALPKESLLQMQDRQEKDIDAIKEIDVKLTNLSKYKKALASYKSKLTFLHRTSVF